MAEILVHRKIVPWGNGFGIRLTKAELARLGLRPRDEAEVIVRGERKGVDLSHIHFINLGPNASERHDEIIGEGMEADFREAQDADRRH